MVWGELGSICTSDGKKCTIYGNFSHTLSCHRNNVLLWWFYTKCTFIDACKSYDLSALSCCHSTNRIIFCEHFDCCSISHVNDMME